MKFWFKILIVAALLLGFQLLLPAEGVSFLSIDQVEFGELKSEEAEVLEAEEKEKDKVYFFGDIMLGRDVERKMNQAGLNHPFEGFSIASSSYAVANFESAIPEVHVPTANNTFRFSTPKSSLQPLKLAGFTHLGLANNHTFDFGLSGYNQTVSNVWDSGLVPFGHPSVVAQPSYTLLKVSDTTVGILAIHTLYGQPTKDSLATVFETMKSESDLQVAYVHWGEEYVDTPSQKERDFSKILADLGIDIIIGHHPHVVQSIEMVGDAIVFYSLGNFIFDQYFSIPVQQGLVLKLVIGDEGYLELLPVSSVDTRNQPHEMNEQNKATFLNYLSLISDPTLKDHIIAGRIPLN